MTCISGGLNPDIERFHGAGNMILKTKSPEGLEVIVSMLEKVQDEAVEACRMFPLCPMATF